MARAHFKTGTQSKLPTDDLGEAIELLEQAIGTLGCIELLADPENDRDHWPRVVVDRLVSEMGSAAAGVNTLIRRCQGLLVEAKVIERGRHG